MANQFTLYIKEIQDEEVENTLTRIIVFLEKVYAKNSKYPRLISLSENDYKKISTLRGDVIHNNRILGMKIDIRKV